MATSQNQSPLSTQPYRGTRDFYPDLQRTRTALFDLWRNVLGSFGYEEYDAPLLEPIELYAAKSSEEIVRDQIYSFVDRGERTVAMRPEMTPSLARMVAAKSKQLPRPIRWFSIPRCMRYERPQRGRLREFDQLNVDVFGGIPVDENIEVLSICAQIMKGLGAQAGSYEIRINDRRILNDLLEHGAGLEKQAITPAIQLLDRKDKMTAAEFAQKWAAQFGLDQIPEQHERIIELFGHQTPDEHVAKLLSPHGREPWDELRTIAGTLQQLYPGLGVRIDLGIARGFDYYTGLVFEIFDLHPDNRRALFGGGRYDNLTAAFGTEALPGVGFGVSDVSLINYCEAHGIALGSPQKVDVAVLRFATTERNEALALAAEIRTLGLSCICAIGDQKFGKQIQGAERLGAKAIVFRGSDEIANNTFCVKWLASGEQQIFPNGADGLADFVALVAKVRAAV
jgi:histidyl-tRNA synthetase